MLSCWNADQSERPTFTELRRKIDLLIDNPETNQVFKVEQFEREMR